MALFSKVTLIKDDSRSGDRYQITGMNVYDLKNDIRRYFGRKSAKQIKASGSSMQYHLFSVVVRSIFFGTTNISFESFFSLEVSLIFKWLYKKFGRIVYREAYELLDQSPRLQAIYRPMMNVPSDIESRLSDLKITLMDYQSDFLKLYYNATHKVGLNGYVMAFEQGLGKTYTALATVYAMNLFPCVITAPKSTLYSWKKSIETIMPDALLREDVLTVGDKFIICNYESLSKAIPYMKEPPKSLIIDEIQNFRYMDTARTKNILDIQRQFNIENVLALSGTPIKALASEMIPIMVMIDPLFRNAPQAQYIFKHLYSVPNYDAISAAVLKDRLKLYMVRKEVQGVLDLPDKYKYNLPLHCSEIEKYTLTNVMQQIDNYIKVEQSKRTRQDEIILFENLKKQLSVLPPEDFPEEYLNKYLDLVRDWSKASPFDDDFREIVDATRAMEQEFKEVDPVSTKMIVATRKQITSYMAILFGRAIGEFIIRGKIRLLNATVVENINSFINIIQRSLKKVIIFATYKEPLYTLANELQRNGIKSLVVESASDYNKNSNQFMNDTETRVLLGSVQAIGTGTDGMQYCANTIIFLNRPFRSTDSDQAEARIYRKGQDSTCYVYYVDVDKNEPNVLSSEAEINAWSNRMLSLAGV